MQNTYIDKLKSAWHNANTINTGTSTITLSVLLIIYSLSVVTSLPGLAIAPILGKLQEVFKGTSELDIQLLESLPSLIIIPFILIAGRLSVGRSKRKLLIIGLIFFFLSSIIYLVSPNFTFLLINSIFLGVGAGIVIPLAKGVVTDYFTGIQRTRQLGMVAAISNLSLVLATFLAGYLAGINWRLAFLVYCLSAISLAFAFLLKEPRQAAADVDPKPVVRIAKSADKWWADIPWGLMWLYFFINMMVLTVPFNLSIYIDAFHLGNINYGSTMMAIFFLAMTIPGFFITKVMSIGGRNINFLASLFMATGMAMILYPHPLTLAVGVVLIGFGYGIMQPLIYDKTSYTMEPSRVTYALSLVMATNYLAIIIYPFFQQLLEWVFGTHSAYLPFIVGAVLMALCTVVARMRRMSGNALGMKDLRTLE